ncbi:TonB-dependent receptor [Shewanella sp. VB17]|uniref:TonB-dependent receptor n=1 Tax=Shewanella sp. VB17 TaxID=2739432 RepID=UPI001566965B|nr:TonB-dependent receptor [Shewanella sp. VB17]NRD73590.1 TonB-dependent receptor [Shewanella sp. VB17]
MSVSKRFTIKKMSPAALVVSSVLTSFYALSAEQNQDSELEDEMEVVVVASDFRGTAIEKMPSSVTIIDQQQIEDEGAQHFEDILNSIANLNWSGGSSRPKYFQIRGVGEQEEYQGAPNSSVGYIIDDIDMSGLGMISSMYDLQQVEVLRGPQGTRYGANALAGLIYLKSNDPTDVFEHGAEVSVGDDALTTFSGFSSGPLTDSGKLLYRVSLQQHNQNGYQDNLYLGRDDTNARDEFTGRAKLRWYATDDLEVDLTLLHANYDNGYDVWTLDNNGENTLTDAPGVDKQRTTGSSLKFTYTGADKFELVSLTSYANSQTDYNYDGDWANPDYWAGLDCGVSIGTKPCVYNATWDKEGERTTLSQELRLSSNDAGRIFLNSTNWLIGVYYSRLDEENLTTDYSKYNSGKLAPLYNERTKYLDASYNANTYAVFGQIDTDYSNGYLLSIGLRLEGRQSDYEDSGRKEDKDGHVIDVNGQEFDPSETMWGGHVALSKTLNHDHEAYMRVARGYKAGGFNMSLPVELSDKKEYDTETLYNYEIGLKSIWLDGAANTNFSLFYMDRRDQQVAASQQNPDDISEFILYTENAGSSHNYGAELDGTWYATNNLKLYTSLGWLETAYGDYAYQDGGGNTVDLSGRELAHSPQFTYSAGATYRTDSGWFANVTGSGKSDFYYSDSNESKSQAYTIFNARVGYEAEYWSAYLWGRNLFDEQYGTRGFYFGNEPDQDWADKQYIRYGDPRQLGLTVSVKFL